MSENDCSHVKGPPPLFTIGGYYKQVSLYYIMIILFAVHWGVFSVPSYETEWYWKRLEEGDSNFVEFHNRVYGCSGIQPDKYPCTGPDFSYVIKFYLNNY